MGVAIMISDTRWLWHADMIRSAAAGNRGAKSATSVLGLVLTRWRLPSTDAGRNEALGLHELERRQLQAGTLYSLWIRGIPLLGNSHSNDLDANNFLKKSKKWAAAATKRKKQKQSSKSKKPQVGVLPNETVKKQRVLVTTTVTTVKSNSCWHCWCCLE